MGRWYAGIRVKRTGAAAGSPKLESAWHVSARVQRNGRQTVQRAHLSDVTDGEDGALLWGVAAGVKADVEVAAGLARAGLDPVSDVFLLALRGLESHIAWEHDLLVCLIQPWDEDGDLAVL